MAKIESARRSVPRIESPKVKNYRALHDLDFPDLTPLTVFVGPNGSGKSTVFDVFAFLSECFKDGLRRAWDRRGRFKELRTRGSRKPIEIALRYKEGEQQTPILYHLVIDEDSSGPVVARERLSWRRDPKRPGRGFLFLDFKRGRGWVIPGEQPADEKQRVRDRLESPELLAVNTLGQFARHPRVNRNRSRSFKVFCDGLRALSAQ
jgi:predicted ATPase